MYKGRKFCITHHFNYSGHKCPFCEKDRISSLVRRYAKDIKVNNTKDETIRDITQNDLQKLKEKFSKNY